MSLRNWTIKSTDSSWAVLVTAQAKVNAIIAANTTGSDATFSMRIIEGKDIERATIVHEAQIRAGETIVLDLNVLNLGRADKLQVSASTEGIDFTASGERV